MSLKKNNLAFCNRMADLRFDDYMVGKYVSVKYTHHEPLKFDGTLGEPLYLAIDEKDKALPFYIPGFSNAKKWIMETDIRVEKAIKEGLLK